MSDLSHFHPHSLPHIYRTRIYLVLKMGLVHSSVQAPALLFAAIGFLTTGAINNNNEKDW